MKYRRPPEDFEEWALRFAVSPAFAVLYVLACLALYWFFGP